MIELTILVLLHRLLGWGRDPVIATRVIAADAVSLRRLVSDPALQSAVVARISPRLRPRMLDPGGSSARLVSLCAQLGDRDVLWLTWILTARRGTTEVDLAAQLESPAILGRLLLRLGGRRWLRHRLELALDTVAAMAHDAAEDLDRQALPWARASLRAQRTRAARGRRRSARTTVHERGS